jgi:hypothetical protein
MRKFATAVIAAAALLAAPALLAKPRQTGDERLAKLIEGREAGKPTSCLSSWETRELEVIDKVALVYGRGDTIWVNRPDNAKSLDDDEILVTKTSGSQLCKLDIVQTMDRSAHFITGFVSLTDFVPYKRVAKAN